MKKYILLFLAILWACLIFYASSKNNYESNSHSKYVISIIVNKCISVTNKLKITNIELNDRNVQIIVNKLNYPLRKVAHFMIYFVLGILLYCTLILFRIPKKSIYIVILVCFIYSLTDEYHQSFISGRTSSIMDCLIDTLGATIGCFITLKTINKKENIQ